MAKIICTVTNDLAQDQRMIRICGSLQQAGHSVILVGRALPDSKPLVKHPFEQVRLRCFFTKGKWFYLEYNLRLLLYLLRQKVDFINAVDLDTLLPAYLHKRLRGSSCVYDAHEYFTEVPELIDRPRTQAVWQQLARSLVPRVDAAYTVGPALAEVMGQAYEQTFGVVRNVPISRPPAPLASTPPHIILYQGMLNEGRGLEQMIDAMPLLPSSCQLWLVGKGDCMDALQERVATQQLEDRVVFKGFVPPKQLPMLTQQAWLGINLLEHRGLSYYYSLANKAFDYVQAGLPSLQMAFPEYEALHQTYGCYLLLPALTPTAIAEAIIPLLEDAKRYQSLRSANLKAAEELCWEKEEENLLAYYTNDSAS